MPKRSARSRPRHPRKFSPRIIIACEGRKTEYNYFTKLNGSLGGKQRAALVVVPGKGGIPTNVVNQAIRQRKIDRTSQRFDPDLGDRVYAILDVEPHDRTKAQPLREALELAKKNEVTVLLSNPSFEVWLLCHVISASELRREFASPAEADALLKNKFGSNKEELNARPQRYGRLLAAADDAVMVAREVHQQHRNCADLRNANACTEVYRLVEYLLGQTDTPP